MAHQKNQNPKTADQEQPQRPAPLPAANIPPDTTQGEKEQNQRDEEIQADQDNKRD